jgi:hypothetical protein
MASPSRTRRGDASSSMMEASRRSSARLERGHRTGWRRSDVVTRPRPSGASAAAVRRLRRCRAGDGRARRPSGRRWGNARSGNTSTSGLDSSRTRRIHCSTAASSVSVSRTYRSFPSAQMRSVRRHRGGSVCGLVGGAFPAPTMRTTSKRRSNRRDRSISSSSRCLTATPSLVRCRRRPYRPTHQAATTPNAPISDHRSTELSTPDRTSQPGAAGGVKGRLSCRRRAGRGARRKHP